MSMASIRAIRPAGPEFRAGGQEGLSKVHHRKKVREWLGKRVAQIDLFFLHAYSPELKPDEYLNGDLKAQVHGGRPARNRDELETKMRGAMMKLQVRPGPDTDDQGAKGPTG